MESSVFWAGFAIASIGTVVGLFIARASLARRSDPALTALAAGGEGGVRLAFARPGPVSVRGIARPLDGAVVTEPVEHTPTVWYRVEGYVHRPSSQSHGFRLAHVERDARDFLLDDGSGAPAIVTTEHAGYVTPIDMFGGVHVLAGSTPWTRHDLTDVMVESIRERSDDNVRVARIDRHCVRPGDEVTVVGWFDRTAAGPVIRPEGDAHPLVVYGVEPDVLRADRDERTRNRRVIGLVCVVAVVAGVGAMVWGADTIGL